jgi:hypothetical protein
MGVTILLHNNPKCNVAVSLIYIVNTSISFIHFMNIREWHDYSAELDSMNNAQNWMLIPLYLVAFPLKLMSKSSFYILSGFVLLVYLQLLYYFFFFFFGCWMILWALETPECVILDTEDSTSLVITN